MHRGRNWIVLELRLSGVSRRVRLELLCGLFSWGRSCQCVEQACAGVGCNQSVLVLVLVQSTCQCQCFFALSLRHAVCTCASNTGEASQTARASTIFFSAYSSQPLECRRRPSGPNTAFDFGTAIGAWRNNKFWPLVKVVVSSCSCCCCCCCCW